MTEIIEIKNLKELKQYKTIISKGSYNTATHSLKQGKPTYLAIINEKQEEKKQ